MIVSKSNRKENVNNNKKKKKKNTLYGDNISSNIG